VDGDLRELGVGKERKKRKGKVVVMLKRCRRQMRSEPWLKVVPDMRQASASGSSQLYRPWRPGRASSTAATRDKAIIGFPVTGKLMFLLVVRVDFWMIPSVSVMSCCGKTFLPFAVYPCTSYCIYLCHPSR
jgi:hypothetical protein